MSSCKYVRAIRIESSSRQSVTLLMSDAGITTRVKLDRRTLENLQCVIESKGGFAIRQFRFVPSPSFVVSSVGTIQRVFSAFDPRPLASYGHSRARQKRKRGRTEIPIPTVDRCEQRKKRKIHPISGSCGTPQLR